MGNIKEQRVTIAPKPAGFLREDNSILDEFKNHLINDTIDFIQG